MTWIQTYTGRCVDLLKPKVDQINIQDIAVSLSRQCRFNGHCREFYSVAQHSCLVAAAVWADLFEMEADKAQPLVLWALMHDAAEAYCGDLVAPAKQILRHVDDLEFDDLEARLMRTICRRFGMEPHQPAIVKNFDLRLLATERRDLMGECRRDWQLPVAPLSQKIEPWNSEQAAHIFFCEFQRWKTP